MSNVQPSGLQAFYQNTVVPNARKVGAFLSELASKVMAAIGPWLCKARQAVVSLVATLKALPLNTQIAAGGILGLAALVGFLFHKCCCAPKPATP